MIWPAALVFLALVPAALFLLALWPAVLLLALWLGATRRAEDGLR